MPLNSPPAQRPSVLIVDDEQSLRMLLHTWLGRSGYEVVTAGDGFEAIACLQARRFDVVVTDLNMPGMTGLHLLTMIQALAPETIVIFLSACGTVQSVIEALHEGRAFDFLQKPLPELRQLNLVIEKALMQRDRKPRDTRASITWAPAVEALNELERRLVGLLAEGFDNRRIAEQLHFSEKTVRNYLSRVYEKLGVGSRLEAVAVCQRHDRRDGSVTSAH